MIKPIRNLVLVEPFPSDDVTDGGLIIPDSVKKISNKVRVVEVGNKVTKVKKGDIAYRVDSWGTEISENNIRYYLLDANAILAYEPE